MAKIKYSALVSDMRGKLNGSVMSKNRYGAMVRNKVTPVNARTVYQREARDQFGALSRGWRALTDEEMESWRSGAANYKQNDIFGDQQELAGNALFIKLNQNLINVGGVINTVCPKPGQPEAVAGLGIAYTNNVLTLTATKTLGDTANFTVYAAANVSPGKQYVKNLYKFIMSGVDANAIEHPTAEIEERFGSLVPGTRLWVIVSTTDMATGQATVGREVSILVQ